MVAGEFPPSSSTLPQTALIGVACAADLAINYPLWIVAKRVAAGMTVPRSQEMYKGAGAVWLAYFPTVACDDQFSRGLTSGIGAVTPKLGRQGEELAACAAAGAIAGLAVCAPSENIVTKAHATNTSVPEALKTTLRSRGLVGTLCPFGQTMMVGREVPFAVGIFFLRDRMADMCHRRIAQVGQKSIAADDKCSKVGQPSSASPSKETSVQWWSAELASSMLTAAAVNIIAHPPSVILAWQQAREVNLSDAVRHICASHGISGFYKGFIARSVSLGGAMFVVPTVLSCQGWEGTLREVQFSALSVREAILLFAPRFAL